MSRPQRVLVRRGAEPALGARLPDDDVPDGRSKLYLHPGHLFASAKATAISTIASTSVAVCLYDPILGAGGMCHFQLPQAVGGADGSTRFAGAAIDRLMARLINLGADRARLRAKVFGGACPVGAYAEGDRHLGARNVEIARCILGAQSIVIHTEDVGGSRSRKLRFCTDGGAAWARQL